MKKTIDLIQSMKQNGQKIAMLTAYDYPTARILNDADIDIILVGDSLGMVVLGYEDTRSVTMADMLHHTPNRGTSQYNMFTRRGSPPSGL